MIQLRARLAAALASAATVALVWVGAAAAAPSDIDPAFGSGTGFVVTPYSGGQDIGNFVLPRADGTIVVVASSRPTGATGRPLVIRYLSSGQLDPGFGAGGFAQFVLGAQDYFPVAAALDAVGRVYVLAQGPQLLDASNTGGPTDYRLLRVTAGGALDATFGTGGVVQFRASDFSTSAPAYHPPVLLLQGLTATSDGGVALAGSYDYQQFTNCCYLARGLVIRLNADGTYNGNFAAGGVLRFSAGNASNVALRSLLAAAAGKLVLAGYRQATNGGPSVPMLARVDASGATDATFGTGGVKDVQGLASTTFVKVASRPGGRLVAATGSDANAIEIVAFDGDGAIDAGFGSNGVARVDTGAPTLNALLAQANGRILALARLPQDANPGDHLFRFTDAGVPDATFGAGGKLRTNRMLGIALQSDGRILGAGGTTAYTAGPGSVFVARYLGDPVTPATGTAATYHYTGALFNTIQNFLPPCAHAPCFNYTGAMRVTGELTVAAPLAPNLTNQDIAASITAFSFSDGVQTLTISDASRSASVSTDAQGNITSASLNFTRYTSGAPFAAGAWYNQIRIGAPAVGGGSLGLVNAQCGGNSCLDAVTDLNAYSIGASNLPGTWTRPGASGSGVFDLNQHGLTGSWFEPATAGQGVELDVFPDLIGPGTGYVFGSWFTFDHEATGGAERQRWYTFDGEVKAGQTTAAVTLYQNVGGNFDAPPVTTSSPVGAGTLEFADCSSGALGYTFTDGSARGGTIPLTRLTANVTCTSGTAATNELFALSGNWYAPATSGQGITVEVNPVTPIVFLTWYTYAPNGQAAGLSGQRWYSGESAQTPFAPGQRSFALTLYETVGGLFDTPTTPGPATTATGTATLTFQSCTTAQLVYNFTGGSNVGRSGTIALARLGPAPPGCVS